MSDLPFSCSCGVIAGTLVDVGPKAGDRYVCYCNDCRDFARYLGKDAEVLDAAGNRLGYRELFHPHVDEQPFTRSLRNVMIPDGTTEVFIRVRCNRDNWSGALHPVALKR